MNDMGSAILMSVAMPKQFLWAPFEMAIINIILALMVMLLCIGVIGWTPFVSLIPLVAGHVALITIGTRNPHLTTTLQAGGKYPPWRKNIANVSVGTKYIP